jgi:hypothetical protein
MAFSSGKSGYDRRQDSVQWLIVAGVLLSSARVDLLAAGESEARRGCLPKGHGN